MYLRTVRGETWIPTFSSSSLAMRSLPQRGFSRAMRRMRRCSSAGIAGRPGREFRRHSSFQALRCQRSHVSGRTTTNASRQSKSRDSRTRRSRVTGFIRCGLTLRSTYRLGCRRRKRFSALTDRLDRTVSLKWSLRGGSHRRELVDVLHSVRVLVRGQVSE